MTNDDLTVFRERNTRKRLSNAAALIGKADDAVFEACRPTGYAELDRCLGGGLTAGLHCLGAVPSLGKSTYVMQMAEQMAAEGTHVIVISLEMKPVDLAAKAVSRQLKANPKLEICASITGSWLRIQAEAVEDDRREARKSMLDAYPELRRMYDEDDGNTQVFFLKNAEAVFSSFMAPEERVSF